MSGATVQWRTWRRTWLSGEPENFHLPNPFPRPRLSCLSWPELTILVLNTMFNKVLILSASAGAGHVRAADALEKAFIQSSAAREVRHVDVLNYTNKVFRHL